MDGQTCSSGELDTVARYDNTPGIVEVDRGEDSHLG